MQKFNLLARVPSLIPLFLLPISALLPLHSQAGEIFDIEAIRDPETLDIEVLQDWHIVKGPVPSRQKLITINVGEIWEGQGYRLPVRMVVPLDRKAHGFHLTGGSTPKKLEVDFRPRGHEAELIKGGVGLVTTVVQEPGTYGKKELSQASEARFAKSLDPRHKIQYWAWPATLMRAITAAYTESDHFEKGKIAVTGSSKNGASPSMAIIHDDRMTAVHATVSPIWDSPLRLCEPAARQEHQAAGGRQRGFSGGHYGPNFNQRAIDAGHTWEELQKFTEELSDSVFISRNIGSLRERGVEMLFHPGTHDMVAYDLAWGGKHHPSIPVYLGANTGHGGKGHPETERHQQNKAAFILRHFFPDQVTEPLLTPPVIEALVDGNTLSVRVRFPNNAGDESGRIWWINDRAPDGSPRYLKELIPDENTMEMNRDQHTGDWTAVINLAANISHIDVFSNHRKTITFQDKKYPSYISSPYTRVSIKR